MYYIYSKNSKNLLPKFQYSFNNFEDFYEISKVLTKPLFGRYFIHIDATKHVNDLFKFIDVESDYKSLEVYIRVEEEQLNVVHLNKPGASMLSSKDTYDVWVELVNENNIKFDSIKTLKKVFYAIPKDYDSMLEAVNSIRQNYSSLIIHNELITEEHISKLFLLDTIKYPRQVVYQYVYMTRWRASTLKSVLEYFGNDMTYYAMKKNIKKLVTQKIDYLKTGKGSDSLKKIPFDNLLKLYNTFILSNSTDFKDVQILLMLYEKGETVDDIIYKTTCEYSD